MDTIALLTAKAWIKNGVEAIEYGGEIRINQGHLQEKLGLSNIYDKTQYYPDKCKKMRCEIQECGKYQPCRMFIENALAIDITMNSVKTQAAIFKSKFGVKQHDKVLRKQQSLSLRLKKIFPNEDIIEEYSALNYRTNFTFKKHMLVVEIDEKEHADRDPDYEKKRQKDLEKIDYYFIRINSDKKGFNNYEEFGKVQKHINESTKKQTKKHTKNH